MSDSMRKSPEALRDISKTAINLVFATMILCIAVLGGYAVYQAQKLNQHTEDIYSHPFVVSNALRDISIQIISMRSNMQDIPFTKIDDIDDIVASMQHKEARALADFDTVMGAFLGDRKKIEKTRNMFIHWREIRDAIVLTARSGERKKAHYQTHGFGLEHVNKLRSRIKSHIEYANAKAKLFREASSRLEDRAIITSVFLSLIILVITIMSFVFISRRHQRHQQENRQFIKDIKKSEDKFRDILDAAPDGLLVVDHSGMIHISNHGAQSVFGHTQEQLAGQHIDMLIPDAIRHGHHAMFTAYFNNPHPRTMLEGRRLEALHKAGHLFPVTISLSPVTLDGETFVTCNVRDMTRYEQLEENFRQAQKMESIGTLVGGIAHDFNNILAAITGAVFLAKRRNDKQKYLSNIETQAERASGMVKQLLAFARKDIHKMEPLSLSDVVKQSSQFFKFTLAENIQLNIDLCTEGLAVKGDSTQLQQVVLNLVNNARDALSGVETPVITIALQKKPLTEKLRHRHPAISSQEFACISVSDNGHGIEEQYIKEIFEPFFTRKEVGKGTGLGLAMVKGTIESHGGIVDVESLAGEGAIFYIYLPLLNTDTGIDADSDVNTDADAVFASGSGECILLVDDELAVREINCEILETLGYRVIDASDGITAVEAFKDNQHHVKLIIMDVVMPRMSGIKAAEKIRNITDSVPIIFATGYDRSQVLSDQDEGLSNSAIMTKPFKVAELDKLIKTLI